MYLGVSMDMRDLFSQDSERFAKFSVNMDFGDGSFLLDYSKNIVSEETMKYLFDLAREVERVFML